MCSGHASGVHRIDLEDQRRAGGMLLGFLEVLGVPWRFLGSFGCLLGGSGASLDAMGASWDCPGSLWGDFGDLRCSLGQSWEVRMWLFRWF